MPNITFTAAQAPGSNECGAFALAAALEAFGSAPPHATVNLAHHPGGLAALTLRTAAVTNVTSGAALGQAIYAITGDLAPPPAPLANGGYTNSATATNSPSALTYVARAFGRTVTVHATTAGLAAFSPIYPNEQARCGAEGATVQTGATYAAPTAGQVQLICVQSGHNTFHWLARGENGRYYDPGNGTNNNNWGNPGGTGAIGPYTFAGIWMTLS